MAGIYQQSKVKLRPHQQEAFELTIKWLKKSTEPILITAPTGFGKSHLIAAIADEVHKMTGKFVLCTAPSVELVEQNHGKYIATGNPASIFSASAGVKSLEYPVVFGTPQSILNDINRFGEFFCLGIFDEAHRNIEMNKKIVNNIKERNPYFREIGLTATDFTTNGGYIFHMDEDNNINPVHIAYNPPYRKRIYSISTQSLISQGWLTVPRMGTIGSHIDCYRTLHMKLNNNNKFDQNDIDRAFLGQGRKTSIIIADIIEQSRDREGVLIFAATTQHAQECMDSLPPELSAVIGYKTSMRERRKILELFKNREIKYLVNKDILTTGFDAPHVDVVALLRATESPVLLQQIIGRGLRLCEGKHDCLILDYAENFERHCPDGDIFSPEIKASVHSDSHDYLNAICPLCGSENKFRARKNKEGFDVDENGYFLDLSGGRITNSIGDYPAHFGRRCQGGEFVGGVFVPCDYRWTFKPCDACGEENDIAARICTKCGFEIIDPNEKLRIEFRKLKRDPYQIQCDKVEELNAYEGISFTSKKRVIRVEVRTPYRRFDYWLMPESAHPDRKKELELFMKYTKNNSINPSSITYMKDPKTKFYRVLAYDQEPDSIN